MRYQYRNQHIVIEDQSFVFQVFDQFDRTLDDFLDTLPSQELDLTRDLVPLYGRIWPSAATLANFVARRHAGGLQGTRVLEVGCGLGLPAMTAARLGAQVIAADYLEEIGSLLDHNARVNRIPGISFAPCDFRQPPPASWCGEWDLILASEITYERQYFPVIIDFLQKLAAPGGVVYLADPLRTYHQELVDGIRHRGDFLLESIDCPAHQDFPGTVCRILHLTKCSCDR